MSEPSKKDLPGVFDFAESIPPLGASADAPFPNSPDEEAIDSFESLDEYSRKLPENPLLEDSPFSVNEEVSEKDNFEEASPKNVFSSTDGDSPELNEPASILPDFTEPAAFPVSPVPPAATSVTSVKDTLGLLREFAERVPVGKPVVAAAFPFSLRIEGHLTAEEKEKLIDLLNRENMGIREVDLEPQLQAGRILIPRISEFAAILLVQALRGVQADMRIGPSDSIYATAETRTPEDENAPIPQQTARVFYDSDGHAAESLPVTSLPFLPELPHFNVIEVLTASASLKSQAVEAERSNEYQDMLEALQREIRYKAFHKGATAVVNYSIALVSLSLPSHYRITASGSAIRPKPFV